MTVVIARFVAIFITVISLAGCGEEAVPPEAGNTGTSNAVAVFTVELQLVLHAPQIITTGTIQAVDEVVLSVDVSAPIAAIKPSIP